MVFTPFNVTQACLWVIHNTVHFATLKAQTFFFPFFYFSFAFLWQSYGQTKKKERKKLNLVI